MGLSERESVAEPVEPPESANASRSRDNLPDAAWSMRMARPPAVRHRAIRKARA